jgi:glycolate oxidase FAD binding subunit
MLGDGRFASATDRPENVDALCATVRSRVAQGLALYPQGGRSALNYGGIPRRPGVAIDTTALAQVVDYPHADMTITVEAGLTLAALKEILDQHNQRLPLDAPQPDHATLGGIFATNTSGPRRYGAGRPRDFIIGVSFVNAEGAVIKGGGRVVKNVAGYDFPRLLTGSLGTLGIITQLTLKVRPAPGASAIVWSTFASAREVAAALDRLNTSETRPIAIELFNAVGARVATSQLGLPVAAWNLAIGFEDNTPAVLWQLERIQTELSGRDMVELKGHRTEALWEALTEFQAKDAGWLTFTANLRPSKVATFVGRLDPVRWAVQAHAGNGIVRAHLLEALNLEVIAAELEALREKAVAYGGNLTVPRCATEWKETLKVWGAPRPDWSLAERVKRALDPLGVMNPGRFVGTI